MYSGSRRYFLSVDNGSTHRYKLADGEVLVVHVYNFSIARIRRVIELRTMQNVRIGRHAV